MAWLLFWDLTSVSRYAQYGVVIIYVCLRGGDYFMPATSLVTATVRLSGTDAGVGGTDAAADVHAVLRVLVALGYCSEADITVSAELVE